MFLIVQLKVMVLLSGKMKMVVSMFRILDGIS